MKKDAQKRKERVLRYIEDFYLVNKYPPTVRKIAKGANIKSISTVHKDINDLALSGFVDKVDGHVLPGFTEGFIRRFIRELLHDECGSLLVSGSDEDIQKLFKLP